MKRRRRRAISIFKIDDYLANILGVFDEIDLENEYKRCLAIKALIDYYRTVVLEVSVQLCGFDRNIVIAQPIMTRWRNLEPLLSSIEDPKKWDQLIAYIHKARNLIEHKDYYVPKRAGIESARKQAIGFKNWIVKTATEYIKVSKGFSFTQEYLVLSHWYIGLADSIINRFGEKPYLTDTAVEKSEYQTLRKVKRKLNERTSQIRTVNDLKKEDLNDLITLVKIVEHMDAKESVFLRFNLCPRCGGKIVETESSVGGSEEDPMPTGIVWRIGCEKCDYTVNEDSFDI